MLKRVTTVIGLVGIAALVGLLTFALTAYALRPYTSIAEPLRLTEPEWIVAALLGALFAAVAAWRLANGASFKDEMRKLFSANTDGDALD